MAEYDGANEFRKAGLQRLRDAEQLLQRPTIDSHHSDADKRHLRGAMYLAGYSIECVLKEYIISHTPPAMSLEEACKIREAKGLPVINFSSAAGHNLQALLALTDLESNVQANSKVRIDWHICLRWKSTWRYDPDLPARAYAEEFAVATRNVYQWIKQRV